MALLSREMGLDAVRELGGLVERMGALSGRLEICRFFFSFTLFGRGCEGWVGDLCISSVVDISSNQKLASLVTGGIDEEIGGDFG